MTALPTGALQQWLRPRDPDAPAPNGHLLPPLHDPDSAAAEQAASASTGAPAPEPVSGDATRTQGKVGGRLAALQQKLDYKHGVAVLQRDPAWLDVLSRGETLRERWAAKRIRAMHRRQQVAEATATLRRAGRERAAAQRLARMETDDQLWQRRALARRARLLDPGARLAAMQRTHRLISFVLRLVALVGIGWTAAGVHDALVGPDGTALAYVVEPLFSLPLLVIMTLRARAAVWARVFPSEPQRKLVRRVEATLLAATIAINTSPVLPWVGQWKDATTLLAHLCPPLLIVIAVLFDALAAQFFAELLADAHLDADDVGATRLPVDTYNVMTLIARIQAARAAGELPDWADTGLPSVSAIARHFTIEKRKAQQAIDALRLLGAGASRVGEEAG